MRRLAMPVVLGIVVLLLVGCAGGGGGPSQSGSVGGRIFYLDGETEVLIDDREVALTIGSRSSTPSTGTYVVTGISVGNRTVNAEATGFSPYQASINVVSGLNPDHDIEMIRLEDGVIAGTVEHPIYGDITALDGAFRVGAPRARIELHRFPVTSDSSPVATTTADENGVFELTDVPYGEDYVIWAFTEDGAMRLSQIVPGFDSQATANLTELTTIATEIYGLAVFTGHVDVARYAQLQTTIDGDFAAEVVDIRKGGSWFDADFTLIQDVEDYMAIAGDDLHETIADFVNHFVQAHSSLKDIFDQQWDEYNKLIYFDENEQALSGEWAWYFQALTGNIALSLEHLFLGTIFDTEGSGRYEVVGEDQWGDPILNYMGEVGEPLGDNEWRWEIFVPDLEYWIVYDFFDELGLVSEWFEDDGVRSLAVTPVFAFEFGLFRGDENGPGAGTEDKLAQGTLEIAAQMGEDHFEILEATLDTVLLLGEDYETALQAAVEIDFDSFGAITNIILEDASLESVLIEGTGRIAISDIRYLDPLFAVALIDEEPDFVIPFYPSQVELEDNWILYMGEGGGKLAELSGSLFLSMGFNANLNVPLPDQIEVLGNYDFFGGEVQSISRVAGSIEFSWPNAEDYLWPSNPQITAGINGLITGSVALESGPAVVEFDLGLDFSWMNITRPELMISYDYPGGSITGTMYAEFDIIEPEPSQHDLEFERGVVQVENSDGTLQMTIYIQDGITGRIANGAGQRVAEIRNGSIIMRDGSSVTLF